MKEISKFNSKMNVSYTIYKITSRRFNRDTLKWGDVVINIYVGFTTQYWLFRLIQQEKDIQKRHWWHEQREGRPIGDEIVSTFANICEVTTKKTIELGMSQKLKNKNFLNTSK